MPKGPKRLDSAAKLAAELDLEGMLLLLGLIPEGSNGEIEPIEREAVLPQLRIDHGCRLTSGGSERIFVIEFLTRWKSSIGLRMRRYHRAAELKYSKPVICELVLLSRKNAPKSRKNAPKKVLGERRFGEHRFLHDTDEPFRYRIHKMWEIPAAKLLSMGRKELYPFVPLADHRPEDIVEANRRLGAAKDRGIRMRLSTFCGVYYSQEAILKLLGDGGDMWMEELARESSVVKAIAEKAAQKAAEKAREEGREEGLRAMLLDLLSDRFPELAGMPEIGQLGYDELAIVMKAVITSRDAKAARREILGVRKH